MKGLVALLSTFAVFSLAAAVQVNPHTQPPAAPPSGAPSAPKGVPPGHPQVSMPKAEAPKVAEGKSDENKAGADWPKPKPEDVATIDGILKAFYEAPAGQPGQARDWDRYRSLFLPQARLIPARVGAGGTAGAFFLSVTDYVDANKTYFEKGGFSDREVARRVEEFGYVVHVWSTYESRRRAEDPTPYVRGINSIQLLKDTDRYWIVDVFWDFEQPDKQVPEKYLSSPK